MDMEASEQVSEKHREAMVDELQEMYSLDEELLKALIDPHDEDPVIYCKLGTLLMQQGRLDDALQCLEDTVNSRPDYFEALFNGGLCHLHLEKKEQALIWFSKAAALKPEDWQVQYVTGEILLNLGRAEEALPYFRGAYGVHPAHFETLQGLTIALFSMERFEEAACICDETMRVHGTATLPLQLKGDAMLALDRYEEAVRCHIDLCRIDLDSRDFVVSRLQILKNRDKQAHDAYAEIVQKSYPEFAAFVKSSLPAGKKSCSGCSTNQPQKEKRGDR